LALKIKVGHHEKPKFFMAPFFSFFIGLVTRRVAEPELNHTQKHAIKLKFGHLFLGGGFFKLLPWEFKL
jgi:hypothetical protein